MPVDYTLKAERPQDPLTARPFYRYEFPDGTPWTEFHRRGRAYLLRFPGYADFEVSEGGVSVICHPAPGADPITVEHLWANQVLPLALSGQGKLAYHASAVTVGDGTVAFLGTTGKGKSTLAAHFASTGARFLTDDGLLLTETAHGIDVQPSRPSIRLWKDSQDAVLPADVALAAPVSFTAKSRLMAGPALPHCDEPRRLLAAFVLDNREPDDVVIKRASGIESVLGWIGNSFLLDVEDQALLLKHFENATRVAAAVPTFHLDYPRRYDRLAEVQAAIVSHLGAMEIHGAASDMQGWDPGEAGLRDRRKAENERGQ